MLPKCSLCGRLALEDQQAPFRDLRRSENKKYLEAGQSFFGNNPKILLISSCSDCISLLDQQIDFKNKVLLHAEREDIEKKCREKIDSFFDSLYPQKSEIRVINGILCIVPESRKNCIITVKDQSNQISFSSRIQTNIEGPKPTALFGNVKSEVIVKQRQSLAEENEIDEEEMSQVATPSEILEPAVMIKEQPTINPIAGQKRKRMTVKDYEQQLIDLGLECRKGRNKKSEFVCVRCHWVYKNRASAISHAERCIRCEQLKEEQRCFGINQ